MVGNVYVKWSHIYVDTQSTAVCYMRWFREAKRSNIGHILRPTDKYMHIVIVLVYSTLHWVHPSNIREIHNLSQNVRRNHWNVVYTEIKNLSIVSLSVLQPLWSNDSLVLFSVMIWVKPKPYYVWIWPDQTEYQDETSRVVHSMCLSFWIFRCHFFCCCLFVSHTTLLYLFCRCCCLPACLPACVLYIMPILLFRWAFGENLSYWE